MLQVITAIRFVLVRVYLERINILMFIDHNYAFITGSDLGPPGKYLSPEVKRAGRESAGAELLAAESSWQGVGLLLAKLGHLVRTLDNYRGE